MQYQTGPGGRHFLRLHRGEPLMKSLSGYCKDQSLRAGRISGIGAVEDTRLAYYDLSEKRYLETHLPDLMELVSFSGNLTIREGEPFVHAHAVLSDRDCVARGGHMVEATVGVLVELILEPVSVAITRQFEEEIGLYAWSFETRDR
ncbi:MAG: DNA-binding protein [Planctomycetota bacterium]